MGCDSAISLILPCFVTFRFYRKFKELKPSTDPDNLKVSLWSGGDSSRWSHSDG